MLVACSTMPLRGVDAVAAYTAAYRAAFAAKPLFELGYAWEIDSPSFVPGLRDAVVSVHAPCPRAPYIPNLGSRDAPVLRRSLEDLRTSAETAASFGAGFVVLHPGYTLDTAVPLDADRRSATLARHSGGEERFIWSRGGSICAPGYCESTTYRLHREVAAANLAEALRLCADEGVELAVENLNPRVGYLFQLPAELVGLVHALPRLRICVDIGHLWIASLVHGFDFLSGLRDILATGRVACAHVHDNGSQLGRREVRGIVDAPPEGSRFVDDHLALGRGTIPIAAAVGQLKRAGVGILVIETRDPPLESVRRLMRMLGLASVGSG
jgi:sugar phosphate isomerase/epimerase